MEANTKNCPFCGELIKSDAQKCRYCREWLNEPAPIAVPPIATAPAPESAAPAAENVSMPELCTGDTTMPRQESKIMTTLNSWYQNSYLLFFILTTLIYGGGNFLKNGDTSNLPKVPDLSLWRGGKHSGLGGKPHHGNGCCDGSSPCFPF